MFMRLNKAGRRTTFGCKPPASISRELLTILIASFLSRLIARRKGRQLLCPTVAQVLACLVTPNGCGTGNSAARLVFVGSQAPRTFLPIAWDILGTQSFPGNNGADMQPAPYSCCSHAPAMKGWRSSSWLLMPTTWLLNESLRRTAAC